MFSKLPNEALDVIPWLRTRHYYNTNPHIGPNSEHIKYAIILLNERGNDARKVMQLHDMIQIYNTQLKTVAYIDARFGLQCSEMEDMQNYVMSDDEEFGIPFVQDTVKGEQPIVGFTETAQPPPITGEFVPAPASI